MMASYHGRAPVTEQHGRHALHQNAFSVDSACAGPIRVNATALSRDRHQLRL